MVVRKLKIVIVTMFILLGSSLVNLSTVDAAITYKKLAPTMNNLMLDSLMKSAGKSITVRKASDGTILYTYAADKGVTPASTLKILTASAALETLGENYRFSTEVLTDGTIENGTLNGNVYLRGKGDPTLLKSDLDNFAKQLLAQGVKKITGNVIADDSWYDAKRLSPGIVKEDEMYYYAAQISALTISPDTDYDAGSMKVEATPSVTGKVAKLKLTPETKIVHIVNKSKTVPKGYKKTLKITRLHGTNTIVISGNVPVGSSGVREFIALSNPTMYAADVFHSALVNGKITFTPNSTVAVGVTPENAQLLTSKQSMTLKQLMIPFMKLSNNSHAEALAKEMGKVVYNDGSWNSGLQVMREYAASIGLDVSKWNFEDASGMSHKNKVSSSEMSLLLYKIRSEPWYQSFLKGMPIAGNSDKFIGGSLRKRMTSAVTKNKVIAKTGGLTNVRTLSGYVKTLDGEWLIFSIQTQDAKKDTNPSIDHIVSALASLKR